MTPLAKLGEAAAPAVATAKRGPAGSRESLAVICALAGEAIVAALLFHPAVSPGTVMAVHAAVVAWLWLILFGSKTSQKDLTIAALILLMVAIAGPVGAATAVLFLVFGGQLRQTPQTLKDWYARLAAAGGVTPATAMHDRVEAGRVLRFEASPPADFLDVIANGSLEERQAALGLMARQFHPDFAPALEAALRSDVPVVRVQAAAVVARVRGDLKAEIANGLAAAQRLGQGRAGDRVRLACDLSALASCSLTEESDKVRCREVAGQLVTEATASRRNFAAAAAATSPGQLSQVESLLLGSGRFEEFRVTRRIRAIAERGGYRMRLLPGRGA